MCRSMLKRCNVGTGHSVRLVDLVAALNAIFGTDLEPDFQPARAGDVRDSLAAWLASARSWATSHWFLFEMA
jgi:UDP-glucose 4-epimerase